MKTLLTGGGLLLAALLVPAASPAFVLVGDTDRDGTVDLEKDAAGRAEWTASRGAVFLNNSDSDGATGTPDNADTVVNGDADLKDLALLRTTPLPDLAADATVTVSIDQASVGHARLFVRRAGGWALIPNNNPGNITAREAQAGLELRLEALRYAQPVWSGYTTVTVEVTGGPKDSAKLRVAPWIMLPNSQRGTVLYVREHIGRNEAFLAQLRQIVPAAGAELFVIPGGNDPYRSNAIWIQDAMEVGYSQVPGHWMNVVMPSNRNNTLDNFPKDRLLGPDFGWFRQGTYRPAYGAGDGGNSWIDWFGNLEVSPPIPGYPAGRIYYGGDGFTDPNAVLDPAITAMLAAQEIQGPPIRFDAGWLLIRHVDEMICFIPSGNAARPWKVMVPDTGLMFQLLRGWKAEGLGATPLLEIYRPGTTVASLADNTALATYNANVQKRIEANIALLQREFDVRDEELIRVPYLMDTAGEVMVPDMVNAVVLNGHLLMSDPNGPKKEGKDLLQAHMNEKLASTGLQLHYLDDRQYHKWSGNTHCGTNVRREPFEKAWWNLLAAKQAAALPPIPPETMTIK